MEATQKRVAFFAFKKAAVIGVKVIFTFGRSAFSFALANAGCKCEQSDGANSFAVHNSEPHTNRAECDADNPSNKGSINKVEPHVTQSVAETE